MRDAGLMDQETGFERLFRDLGFISRPLFGAARPRGPGEGRSVVLLDGAAASFVMTVTEQPSLFQDEAFYDWAWSVDVPCHVEIVAPREREAVVLTRRWDSPGTLRRFTLPSVLRHGVDFLEVLEQAGRPRALRVLQHGLRLFRIVRESMGSAAAGDEGPIRVFHCLLRSAAAAGEPAIQERWLRAETVGEVAHLIGADLPTALGSVRLPPGIQEELLRPEATTGRRLEAGLLLRHAAGALYQEAHLELSSTQLPLLAGREPLSRGKSRPKKDVVYTPPGLARLLAELAWASLADGGTREGLTVLDPACGSGIFLSEMYRIFAEGRNRGAGVGLRLVGMDESPAATLMARLVLEDLRKEMPPSLQEVAIEVAVGDAVTKSWPVCDLVLMNPPFIAWEDLEADRREALLAACGQGQGGRPDLAMAFVVLALKALRPGGVLATVLPSALLETNSGLSWRKDLLTQASPLLIARLRGGDIFPGVMLEPSILILRKRLREAGDSVILGYSEPGSGEAFLRALRRRKDLRERNKRYEIYEAPASELQVTWLPRSRRLQTMVHALAGNRRVGDLFDVKQGVKTGAKDVFVLAATELRRLPARERSFFRPLAGSKTIQAGRLERTQYVFYPYGEGGPKLHSEEELRGKLGFYYEHYLKPNRVKLQERIHFSGCWWELDRPRNKPWQFLPKLVSAYFGRSGKFAFDASGDFVVGQGFAWLLTPPTVGPGVPADSGPQVSDEEVADVEEFTRQLAPCYLAVFNSRCFEALLAHFAPRVQGGQYDLSLRYVSQIPVPDLISEGAVSSDVVSSLRQAGERIMEGKGIDRSSRLDRWVAEAYGLPLEEWLLGDEL